MKKIIIATILLLLSLASFADIVPKRGLTSITTETRRYADGTSEVGYRLCIAGKECTQIGDKMYYDSRDIAKLYKQQNLHVILNGVATPIAAFGGLFAGVVISYQSPLCLLTALAAGVGTFISFKHQKKDTATIATTPDKNYLVKDDKEIRRLVEKLENLLSEME